LAGAGRGACGAQRGVVENQLEQGSEVRHRTLWRLSEILGGLDERRG